jgi:hypothetical protein
MTIMKPVFSSASEAEIGALFHNCKQATILRTTREMGYPQPATPMQTDNSTACGIANSNIKQQQSRAIDMQFYWVHNQQQQGHFNIFWAPGSDNLANYFTKHFLARHHQAMHPIYVHSNDHITACKCALSPHQGRHKPAPMPWSIPRTSTHQCKPSTIPM